MSETEISPKVVLESVTVSVPEPVITTTNLKNELKKLNKE